MYEYDELPSDPDNDAVNERLQREGIRPTQEAVHSILITFDPPNGDAENTEYFDVLVTALGAELHDLACIIMNRYPESLQIRVACVTVQLRKLLRMLLRYDTTKYFALQSIQIEDTSPTNETGGEG